MTDDNGRKDGDFIVPKWLAGILSGIVMATVVGMTAWLFRMESRVASSETSILYTREAMTRLEQKIDRLLELRRHDAGEK